jgi:uncharacterized SAM-binding protein YcdF (DUF218 family)
MRSPPLPRRIPLPSDFTNEDLDRMERTIFIPSNPQKSDLLFVFGYGSDDWGHVVDLIKKQYAPLILCTGSHPATVDLEGPPESHRIRTYLIDHGLDPKRILVEDRSVSTIENVQFGKQVLEEQGIHPKSILFVCRSHHSGRCLRVLQRFFPDVILSCATTDATYDGEVLSQSTWRNSANTRERVYAEFLRIERLKGDS